MHHQRAVLAVGDHIRGVLHIHPPFPNADTAIPVQSHSPHFEDGCDQDGAFVHHPKTPVDLLETAVKSG